jgi:hypothetical protein
MRSADEQFLGEIEAVYRAKFAGFQGCAVRAPAFHVRERG